jgi:hypothetical protein
VDKVARFSTQDRRYLFTETARKLGIHEAVIEKDFWVCWALNVLFKSEQWGSKMIFKGGTSLSKVFGLIKRFSEDIDLIIDWRLLGYTDKDLWSERSGNQKEKFFKEVVETNNKYIQDKFIPGFKAELEEILQNSLSVEFHNEPDPAVIVTYPRTFTGSYILPQIRLEIGPIAEWIPNSKRSITSFAAKQFPEFFNEPSCEVTVIDAERTFWEKATILHQQAMRGRISPRFSRHYYDLAQMAGNDVKMNAIKSTDILKNVVSFKIQFYPSKAAKYELAKPGTLKLVPPDGLIKELADDYKKMREMIFGESPAFENIIETLKNLESEINLEKM